MSFLLIGGSHHLRCRNEFGDLVVKVYVLMRGKQFVPIGFKGGIVAFVQKSKARKNARDIDAFAARALGPVKVEAVKAHPDVLAALKIFVCHD